MKNTPSPNFKVLNEGKELIRAILEPEYEMGRVNDEDSFVYVQGYDRGDEV